MDPSDLLLPSLSDVRSTTLRTISLGEFETGRVGLSFSECGCKGVSRGLDGEEGIAVLLCSMWALAAALYARARSATEEEHVMTHGTSRVCSKENV